MLVPWTEIEKTQAINLRRKGVPVPEIARRMEGRTYPAVSRFFHRLDNPDRKSDRQVEYMKQRMRRMPEMLDGARRKVAALENEARRYGMDHLLEDAR